MIPLMLLFPCHGGISHHPTVLIFCEWDGPGLRVLADPVTEVVKSPA